MSEVVIIGSGLGGLLCGAILSKAGRTVTILEKNPVIGGCLQSFVRDGLRFETGFHSVGNDIGIRQVLYLDELLS